MRAARVRVVGAARAGREPRDLRVDRAGRRPARGRVRLGGGLRMRAEFPLLLHGYYVDEVFARRFVLANLSYRFPIWPGQDRVHLELVGDYARVGYIRNHHLPRSGLAGVGATLSFALIKGLTLAVGYGYGVDAPRNRGFGGHEITTLLEYKY